LCFVAPLPWLISIAQTCAGRCCTSPASIDCVLHVWIRFSWIRLQLSANPRLANFHLAFQSRSAVALPLTVCFWPAASASPRFYLPTPTDGLICIFAKKRQTSLIFSRSALHTIFFNPSNTVLVMSFTYGLPRGNHHVVHTLLSVAPQLETVFGRNLPSTTASARKIQL
jgi:hypothetical protein